MLYKTSLYTCIGHKHVVHGNVVDGSSMIVFPLVIADSERDMPGIEPGPSTTADFFWHTGIFFYVALSYQYKASLLVAR